MCIVVNKVSLAVSVFKDGEKKKKLSFLVILIWFSKETSDGELNIWVVIKPDNLHNSCLFLMHEEHSYSAKNKTKVPEQLFFLTCN